MNMYIKNNNAMEAPSRRQGNVSGGLLLIINN